LSAAFDVVALDSLDESVGTCTVADVDDVGACDVVDVDAVDDVWARTDTSSPYRALPSPSVSELGSRAIVRGRPVLSTIHGDIAYTRTKHITNKLTHLSGTSTSASSNAVARGDGVRESMTSAGVCVVASAVSTLGAIFVVESAAITVASVFDVFDVVAAVAIAVGVIDVDALDLRADTSIEATGTSVTITALDVGTVLIVGVVDTLDRSLATRVDTTVVGDIVVDEAASVVVVVLEDTELVAVDTLAGVVIGVVSAIACIGAAAVVDVVVCADSTACHVTRFDLSGDTSLTSGVRTESLVVEDSDLCCASIGAAIGVRALPSTVDVRAVSVVVSVLDVRARVGDRVSVDGAGISTDDDGAVDATTCAVGVVRDTTLADFDRVVMSGGGTDCDASSGNARDASTGMGAMCDCDDATSTSPELRVTRLTSIFHDNETHTTPTHLVESVSSSKCNVHVNAGANLHVSSEHVRSHHRGLTWRCQQPLRDQLW
jgi:hypothetical protein